MTNKKHLRTLLILSLILISVACSQISGSTVHETSSESLSEKSLDSNKDSTKTPPSKNPTSTFALTSTPTQTPTSVLTPTFFPTVEAGILKTELWLGGQGGGGELPDICESAIPSDLSELPVVKKTSYFMAKAYELYICLIGFNPDANFTIKLTSPDDNWNGSQEYIIKDDQGNKYIYQKSKNEENTSRNGWVRKLEGIDVASISLWWPIGLPNGQWKISVVSKSKRYEGKIEVFRDTTGIIIFQDEDAFFDPFNRDHCPELKVNQFATIQGVGFNANAKIPIGIYYFQHSNAVLIDSFSAKTGSDGSFSGSLLIKEPYPPGKYFVISGEQINSSGALVISNPIGCFKIGSHQVTNTDKVELDVWQACSDAYLSRLHVGDQAKVGEEPPLPNRVRDQAGTGESKVIGQIEPGEEIEIIDGPACADGWVWWKIRSLETDLVGWTSEGDQDTYWLVPMP